MKHCLCALLLMLSFSSFSQNPPGFLGNKSVITFGASFAPTISNPNKNGNRFPYALNDTYRISFERVYNRINSVSIRYEQFETMVDMKYLRINNPESEERFRTFDAAKISCKAFSLYNSAYTKGIAPVGNYFYYGLKFVFVNTNLSDVTFNSKEFIAFTPSGREYKEMTLSLPNFQNTSVGIIVGKKFNRPFFNKFMFSYGVESTLFIGKTMDYFAPRNTYVFAASEEDIPVRIKGLALGRIMEHQLLSFSLGVGFLTK